MVPGSVRQKAYSILAHLAILILDSNETGRSLQEDQRLQSNIDHLLNVVQVAVYLVHSIPGDPGGEELPDRETDPDQQ